MKRASHSIASFACFDVRAAALACVPLILGLSACTAEGSPDGGNSSTPENGAQETSQAPETQTMSGTAWLTVSEEGAVHVTFLDPDGRYRDLRDGQIVFQGAWETNAEGDLCFVPDNGKGSCWEHGRADSDGLLRATNEDGREIELKRVTYKPPTVPEDGSAEPDEG